MNSIIELKQLTKRFGDKTVVDNVNLTIKKGDFVTLLGPSGCGKTTTLRMIAGLDYPTEGEVLFNGSDMAGLPPHKRPVNTVFQKYALFPHLNVFENIAFGLRLKTVEVEAADRKGVAYMKKIKLSDMPVEQHYTDRKGNAKVKTVKFKNQYKIEEYVDKKGRAKKRKVWLYDKYITDKVKRALKIVGLTDYENRDVNSLSGGQQQRVAIARAIVNEPQVLLLDEPLGALDLKMRQEMQLELKEMHRNLGITFIYVTHDQEEALTMSDSVVVMRDGKILQVGSPIDIYNEPANSYVADFIGESNILNGVMLEDYSVKFISHTFECVDKGFAPNQNVDVVIRPEDWLVSSDIKGAQITGVITSSLFRGVHYEMECLSNDHTLIIHNVDEFPVGSTVGLCVAPDDIHIMRKEKEFNSFKAVFVSDNQLQICGATFDCDPAALIAGASYDAEGDIVVIEGEQVSLKGREIDVRVDFDKIEIEDDENNAPLAGNIESMIYNGKSYIVSIMTDAGEVVLADTEYLWDKGDRIGVKIAPCDFIAIRSDDEEV